MYEFIIIIIKFEVLLIKLLSYSFNFNLIKKIYNVENLN